MVEYLTDWVMGTSNQVADDDIKCLLRCSFLYILLTGSSECSSVLKMVFCVQRLGPGQYGSCGIPAGRSPTAAGGGRRSRTDGGQVSTVPEVRAQPVTHEWSLKKTVVSGP